MEIILPDRESVELVHDVALMTGGLSGVHSENLIQAAVQRPITYIGYVDDYDLDTICAVLIESIARNHGFKDGNKRTALMTAIYTYRLNGVHFKATIEMNTAFDDLVMKVVVEKPSINEICKMLKDLRAKYEGDEEPMSKILSSFVASIFKKPH